MVNTIRSGDLLRDIRAVVADVLRSLGWIAKFQNIVEMLKRTISIRAEFEGTVPTVYRCVELVQEMMRVEIARWKRLQRQL